MDPVARASTGQIHLDVGRGIRKVVIRKRDPYAQELSASIPSKGNCTGSAGRQSLPPPSSEEAKGNTPDQGPLAFEAVGIPLYREHLQKSLR